MKKGFTLTEVLIVLMIIGILSAILMPVAFHAAPDENVLRFKKAYNTLGTIVRELTTSDRYYQDGDLGVKADGSDADGTTFCDTFAELVTAKKKDCTAANDATDGYVLVSDGTNDNTADAKTQLDTLCASTKNPQIVTADGIYWYEAKVSVNFASKSGTDRIFSGPNDETITHKDKAGFDAAYKVICFDVDGPDPDDEEEDPAAGGGGGGGAGGGAGGGGGTPTPDPAEEEATVTKTEPPFGFGIRADGKILSGARADEWVTKKVQKGEE